MVEHMHETKNGDEFLAEQVSVSHSPIRFVLDFVKSTPRIEPGAQNTKMVIGHSVVLIDPYLAKEFVSVLQDNIQKYEKKFGTIEKPEALVKFEKEHAKQDPTVRQDYFG